jgi:hypothetical protein
MESSGELPTGLPDELSGKLTRSSEPPPIPAEDDKRTKHQAPRTIKTKHADTAAELKIITIDQLQSERLKGENHV